VDLTPRLIDFARPLPTPVLVVDLDVVRLRHQAIRSALPGVEVHYAVKANPHPTIASALREAGCGFEVSSIAELELTLGAGARGADVISCNPVKAPEFIRRAFEAGVRRFAFDSVREVEKLAAAAPGAEVLVRVTVDNSGSEWPLSRKYGVGPAEAVDLLLAARATGLMPIGATFHVGSQCLRARSWIDALDVCRTVFDQAASRGLTLTALNLGGGLAVQHTRPIPDLDAVGAAVTRHLRAHFPPDLRLSIEPGRALVGEAAILVSTVIGIAERAGERWVYADAGVFNALMETTGGFRYEVVSERPGGRTPCVLAGPSCDSVDVISSDALLPDVRVGDRLYVLNAGAYTLSYASAFNGFGPPEVAFLKV
jgi:ornithine decarboxylase